MNKAFIFPGQGSQQVGMGKELATAFTEAKEIFQEVDDALDFHLSRLMFEGPQETLTLTENAQPALLTVSMAIMRVLEKQGKIRLADHVACVAGHSLGEYTALAAAGAFPVAVGAKMVRARGKFMQEAVAPGLGTMAALIGLDEEETQAIVKEAAKVDACQIANYNAPGQIVISGATAGVEKAMSLATAKGKRAIPLPVSAPFHSSLMKPAQEKMAEYLAPIIFAAPTVPLIANVTAKAVQDPDEIKALLIEQVTHSVRWTESVHTMLSQGITHMVEIGSGKVLTGLCKRISKEIDAVSIQEAKDIEHYIEQYHSA